MQKIFVCKYTKSRVEKAVVSFFLHFTAKKSAQVIFYTFFFLHLQCKVCNSRKRGKKHKQLSPTTRIMIEKIIERANDLPPISLEEMSGIKLMNRTDTKYVATINQLLAFLKAVQGEYYIQEINGIRLASYHTTYFDTDNNEMYVMHHNGKLVREKIRVRTYEDTEITFLEVKNKNNHKRTNKKRIEVRGVNSLIEEQERVIPFLGKHAWYKLDEIRPTIENWFNRITLVNSAKTERLTIDFNLRFHNFLTDERRKLEHITVIELKRDGNVHSPSLEIFRKLRIKRSGFSKYCMGCALTNKGLKRNNFKERLNLIDKLEKIQKNNIL